MIPAPKINPRVSERDLQANVKAELTGLVALANGGPPGCPLHRSLTLDERRAIVRELVERFGIAE